MKPGWFRWGKIRRLDAYIPAYMTVEVGGVRAGEAHLAQREREESRVAEQGARLSMLVTDLQVTPLHRDITFSTLSQFFLHEALVQCLPSHQRT